MITSHIPLCQLSFLWFLLEFCYKNASEIRKARIRWSMSATYTVGINPFCYNIVFCSQNKLIWNFLLRKSNRGKHLFFPAVKKYECNLYYCTVLTLYNTSSGLSDNITKYVMKTTVLSFLKLSENHFLLISLKYPRNTDV